MAMSKTNCQLMAGRRWKRDPASSILNYEFISLQEINHLRKWSTNDDCPTISKIISQLQKLLHKKEWSRVSKLKWLLHPFLEVKLRAFDLHVNLSFGIWSDPSSPKCSKWKEGVFCHCRDTKKTAVQLGRILQFSKKKRIEFESCFINLLNTGRSF